MSDSFALVMIRRQLQQFESDCRRSELQLEGVKTLEDLARHVAKNTPHPGQFIRGQVEVARARLRLENAVDRKGQALLKCLTHQILAQCSFDPNLAMTQVGRLRLQIRQFFGYCPSFSHSSARIIDRLSVTVARRRAEIMVERETLDANRFDRPGC